MKVLKSFLNVLKNHFSEPVSVEKTMPVCWLICNVVSLLWIGEKVISMVNEGLVGGAPAIAIVILALLIVNVEIVMSYGFIVSWKRLFTQPQIPDITMGETFKDRFIAGVKSAWRNRHDGSLRKVALMIASLGISLLTGVWLAQFVVNEYALLSIVVASVYVPSTAYVLLEIMDVILKFLLIPFMDAILIRTGVTYVGYDKR